MNSQTWAAIGSISSAVAGISAVYVAHRVGKTQTQLVGVDLIAKTGGELDSVGNRKARRAVAEAYLANQEIPATQLEYVLNVFEPLAHTAHERLVKVESIWQSTMGDLVPAYVRLSKEQIARLQAHHPSYFECSVWLDGRLRRRTFWRGRGGRVKRALRRMAWWCTADVSDEELRRLMQVEKELEIRPEQPSPPPPRAKSGSGPAS